MQVCVILLIIEKNMIVIDYGFTLLAVLIPWLNVKCDPLSRWVLNQFKLLALTIIKR